MNRPRAGGNSRGPSREPSRPRSRYDGLHVVAAFLAGRDGWTDDAACRNDADPDRWFPNGVPTVEELDELRQVCESCPVRVSCAKHAIKVKATYGVWAGFFIDPTEAGKSRKSIAAWLKTAKETRAE